jgi:hypothetical protein
VFECGGDAVVDECGDCDGDGANYECWDGSLECDLSDCPDEPVTAFVSFGSFDSNNAEILYSSEVPIAGFQFSVNGAEILGAYGAAAESAGFTISTNSTTVLGFSLTGSTIPAGTTALTYVEWDLENGSEACLENVILSDASGSVINVIADSCVQLDVETCNDSEACNFGNEGDCEYAEENYDCDGNCVVDIDCNGECGGDAVEDDCGECNGDSSSCSGCTDPEADNYDSDATIDDDSCEYSNDGFEVTLDNTGESHLIIFQDSITGLDDGDQIGVFDLNGVLYTVDPGESIEYGEVLVGAATWTGRQLEVSAIMSIDLSDFNGPILNGAVDGNDVSVKIYDASEGVILDADPTFASGGEFGDLFTVVTDLGLSDGPDPVYGCTDSDACNYESDATDDDGSCEYPEENFDCDGNCVIDTDCNGECGGDAVEDDCGECNGDGPQEECWDGSFVCELSDCPTESGLVEIS